MTHRMTMPTLRQRRGGLRVRIALLATVFLRRLSPWRLRRVMSWASRGAHPASSADAIRAYTAVISTSARCAGWHGCLPRSIAVALTCRLAGAWPDWCVGVRAAPPFTAHAWVEAQGELVGENGQLQDYQRLMVVSAGEGSTRGDDAPCDGS